MLKSLFISSFVIIDQTTVDFDEGMTALTGETGAGKSIIINALEQLCGARASSSLVRKGSKKAVIEGVFDMNDSIQKILDELNIDGDDDLIITKEILDNGRSTIKINYRTVTNSALKQVAPYLLDIHSQYQTQEIFNVKNHLKILQSFMNHQDDSLLSEYHKHYFEYKKISQKIKKLEQEDLSDERIEYYQKQYDELKDFEYTDEIIDQLEEELRMMKNYESMHKYMTDFNEAMSDKQGALNQINDALSALGHMNDTESFSALYDEFYNQYYSMQDIVDRIGTAFDSIDFDEYRFNELQEELFTIHRLQRKYGYSVDDIYQAQTELKEKLDAALNREDVLADLNKQKDQAYHEAYQIASKLTSLREEQGLIFVDTLEKELKDLYLPDAKLKVDIKECSLSDTGKDDITFMVSMNKGQAFTPLNETASGGEISRLMLAIKTITMNQNQMNTLVFDEIDTGVSGKVADAIGLKMHSISLNNQVLCITHLPQVAIHADHHYAIKKSSHDEETYSTLAVLSEDERIEEIAKMLSGDVVTAEAIDNAKRLLHG
ncbi:MAG: DNA repair protein RecN [Catenibacterium sp.]|jgi:DNA repair protein RecN|uniref:DNA repair protein RecN n=1 Tax=Catenibacterium sp. TaxID=2049022 RepID=UPI00033CFC4F|nr:DNA repair protein RecN [Catenibacterium sp.]MBS5592848.1 DNA repair protein RecN [Catenibacterium sp.]CDE27764.1 dNA repair protein RecN [Catenibacterium sp. CAG:290]